MPALDSDISAATRDAQIDTQSSSLIKSWHPNARDTGPSPREGWFDDPADTAAMNAEAFELLGTERRAFLVPVMGVQNVIHLLASLNVTPTVRLVDAEQQADGAFMVTNIELDLESDQAILELFG